MHHYIQVRDNISRNEKNINVSGFYLIPLFSNTPQTTVANMNSRLYLDQASIFCLFV